MFFILKELILDFTIVDVLSMGASISTMIAFLIAVVSLWNYYGEKREKLEYDVKKDFFDGASWECIGDNNGFGSFTVKLNRAPMFKMGGEIDYSKTVDAEVFNVEDILFFEVKKARKKKITIEIHQLKEIFIEGTSIAIDFHTIILGTATLKHINPHEFILTFDKDCLPEIPRTVKLSSYEYYKKFDAKTQND